MLQLPPHLTWTVSSTCRAGRLGLFCRVTRFCCDVPASNILAICCASGDGTSPTLRGGVELDDLEPPVLITISSDTGMFLTDNYLWHMTVRNGGQSLRISVSDGLTVRENRWSGTVQMSLVTCWQKCPRWRRASHQKDDLSSSFSARRKAVTETVSLSWVGRAFHARAAAAGNTQWPSVNRRVEGPLTIIIIIIIFISGYQKGHKSPLNWPLVLTSTQTEDAGVPRLQWTVEASLCKLYEGPKI